MFPSADNTLVMPIPFVHPNLALDTRKLQADGLGSLVVMVASPLSIGPDSPVTSLTVTLSVSFDDGVFTVVNPRVSPVEAQGGVNSHHVSYNLAHVDAETIDFSGDTKDSFTGGETNLSATLDKPNMAGNPPPVVSREIPNIANSVAVTYAPRLGLQSRPQTTQTAARFGTTKDEMSIAYLTSIPTPVGEFTLNTGDPVNSVLYTGDLCPGSELFTAALDSVIRPSLLSYVSLPMSYWRGSLKVKVVVFASQIHSAKLAVCSHIGFEADGLSINEAMGQYTTVVDIKGPTVVDITFPWQASKPWLRVCNGSYSDASEFSMGQFSIRVLGPLQYMSSVASSIQAMVFISAGGDYVLSTLENGAVDFNIEPVDA